MPAVATIAVSVTARIKKFIKGLKRGIRAMSNFATKIRRIARAAAKFGSVLTAVSVGAITLFIRQSFKLLDALAKTADRLGLTVDQLRGLERAAELTGTQVEQFRKAIANMVRNVDEAARGTGEAKAALGELNIDLARLARLDPAEQFLALSRAFRDLPSQTRKLALAADIFTLRGTKLLNLLDLGPKRIREMLKESKRLFGSFSRFDLSRIEAANDAIADMGRALRGIADTLAITFAPALKTIADKIADIFVDFRTKLITDIIPAVRKFVISIANEIGKIIHNIRIEFNSFLGELTQGIATLLDVIAEGVGILVNFEAMNKIFSLSNKLAAFGIRRKAMATRLQEQGAPLLGDRLKNIFIRINQEAARSFVSNILGDLRNNIRARLDKIKRAFDIDVGGAVKTIDIQAINRFKKLVRSFLPGTFMTFRRTPQEEKQSISFQQVALSRTFLPGLSALQKREQLVRDPQLAQVIRIAKEGNRILKDGIVGVAG